MRIRGRHSWLIVHSESSQRVQSRRDSGCVKMRVRDEAGGNGTESELSSEVSREPQQAAQQGLMGSDWPLEGQCDCSGEEGQEEAGVEAVMAVVGWGMEAHSSGLLHCACGEGAGGCPHTQALLTPPLRQLLGWSSRAPNPKLLLSPALPRLRSSFSPSS